MQPSNQLKGLIEAYSHVGSEETAQLKMYEKTVVNTIGVYMVSEGYTENDVAEFVATASEGKVSDKFFEALDSGVVAQYITEEGAFDTNLRYVEGAIYERYGSGMIRKAGEGVWNFVKSIPRRLTGFGAKPKATGKSKGTKVHPDVKSTGYKRGVALGAGATGTVSASLEDKDKEAIGRGIRRLARAGGAAIEAGRKEYQKNSFEQEGDQIDELRNPLSWGAGDDKTKTKTKTNTAKQTKSGIRYTTGDYGSRKEGQRAVKGGQPVIWRVDAQGRGSWKSVEPMGTGDRDAFRSMGATSASVQPKPPKKDPPKTSEPKTDTSARDTAPKTDTSARDTAPTTPPGNTASDVKPQKVSTIHTYKAHGSDLHVGRHKTLAQHRAAVAAQKAKKNEEVEMDESLQDTLDKLTKKGQRGLERLGVKINRVKRGTARPAAGSKPGQEGGGKYTREMNEVELVTSFLVSEGFSDTTEGALAMLEGMSESWFNDILDVRLMEEAMLEYLQVMGEAESRDEALYIISEMDEEAIDLLAIEVEDILEATPIPRTDVKYDKHMKQYVPVGGVPVPRASKKPDKKPTTQVAHYEPEGDEIKEKKVYTVTDVDKKGNTEAWKRYQQGNPQYKYHGNLKGV